MANSESYNQFYRDLDLIEGAPKPTGVMTALHKAEIAFAVAERVRQQERDFQIMLGSDTLDAHLSAWDAHQDVMDIDRRPMPTIYQTTEAKTITGKGTS